MYRRAARASLKLAWTYSSAPTSPVALLLECRERALFSKHSVRELVCDPSLLVDRQVGGGKPPRELSRRLAEDRLELADRALEDADPVVERQEDSVSIVPSILKLKMWMTACLLPEPVEAADPLLDAHRVPRQVVVDQGVAELEVQTLAAHLGAEQDVELARSESVEQRVAVLDQRAAVHLGAAVAELGQPPLQVSEGQPEEGEQQHTRRTTLGEAFNGLHQGIELRVNGAEVPPCWRTPAMRSAAEVFDREVEGVDRLLVVLLLLTFGEVEPMRALVDELVDVVPHDRQAARCLPGGHDGGEGRCHAADRAPELGDERQGRVVQILLLTGQRDLRWTGRRTICWSGRSRFRVRV